MPFFASSSGAQINGGNFYDIGGNMNLQSLGQPETDPLMALHLGTTPNTNRPLLGPDRRDRHAGSARMLPYDISRRPQIERHSDDLHGPPTTTETTLLSSVSEAGPIPEIAVSAFLPLDLELDQPSARDYHTTNNDPYPSPANHRLSEYPPYLSSTTWGGSGLGELPSNPYPPPDLTGDAGEHPLALSAFPAWDRPRHEPQTNINGGTFISAHGDVNHIQRHGEPGLHILYGAAANDASHDAGERYPQPQCHPKTRTQMLDDLHAWSSEPNPKRRMLWLHGPAGAGKSAIAQSFCQRLEAEGRLGGSFFFKRGHVSRGKGNKLFPTLAYQLAVLLPEFKCVVSECVEHEPSLIYKSLSTQLQRLIVEPYRDSTPSQTITIVIDGLDEREPHIDEVFREPYLAGSHRPLNIKQSFEDVRKYLRHEFARIHREHQETMGTVPKPWPSAQVVQGLVEKSSGYFIYASTIIKFVDDKDFRPTDRLGVILGITALDAGSGSPFSALDQLYTQILSDVPARPQVVRILTFVAAGLQHSTVGIPKIEQLLQLRSGDVRLTLRRLQSVIELPLTEDAPLTVHHASFLDFLWDPLRSGTFCASTFEHRADLARHILTAFSNAHTDPSLNRNGGHVAWELGKPALKAAWPSPDLLSLFRSLNPDFFFHKSYREFHELVAIILAWLKTAQPLPEDLIQLWEDYRFILHTKNHKSSITSYHKPPRIFWKFFAHTALLAITMHFSTKLFLTPTRFSTFDFG
ncbi:hypothetical protein FB451DRAFT_1413884 [Mycena latifolia]|nr:hypothetical protein FB451DRAFT_1413884 [Mycena latifolia]